MEAYRNLLTIEPDNTTALNNLGLQYMTFEMWDRAAPLFAEALEIGTGFGGTYVNLAVTYSGLGRLGEVEKTLGEMALKHGDNPDLYWGRAVIEMLWGEPEKALQHSRKIDELSPGVFAAGQIPVNARILLEDWQGAAQEAEALASADIPRVRREGLELLATLDWYKGESDSALGRLRQRLAEYPESDSNRAGLEVDLGFALLDAGRPEEALQIFQSAATTGRRDWVEIDALHGEVLAHAELGRASAARAALSRLQELVAGLPGPRWERDQQFLSGRIAFVDGPVSYTHLRAHET